MRRRTSPVVHENVLSNGDACQIRDLVESEFFPWYYNDQINGDDYPPNDGTLNFQFVHNLFRDDQPCSSFLEVFTPVLSFIKPKRLVRLKLNLNPQQGAPLCLGFHTDTSESGYKSAIYYAVSSDGPTVFKDGTAIEPKANRLVTFPSEVLHSGTAPTAHKRRILLNVIYK